MGIEFHRDPDFVERRRIRRESLPIDISIRERSRSSASARLVDFNANGCRIAGMGPLLGGGHLWVKLPGLESLSASVVWCERDTAAVAFENPLHHSVAAHLLPKCAAPVALVTAPDHPLPQAGAEELLSRREQIEHGIVTKEGSPLKTEKHPKGASVVDMITRRAPRQCNHRSEPRFADAVSTSPMALQLDGRAAGIENVSASGLKVQAQLRSEIGDSIAIQFDGFPAMAGKLIWRNEREAGLSLPPDSIALDG